MTGARVSAGRPRGVDTAGAVWTVAVFTAVLVVVGHWLFLRVALIGDEPIHLSQVLRFVRGEGGMHPWLTTFPTFHWLASWIVRALGSESTSTVRLASTMLGILVVPAAWFVARARFDRAVSRARAFGVAFLPILVPYFFFIYTDAAALAALLAAVAAAERRRWLLAGAFGLLAVALRQTAIVWVAWLFAQYLWNERPWLAWRADGVRRLREASLFVATGIAFVAFVVLNRGIAIGDSSSHPLGVYDQNLLFFLVVVALLLLPAMLLEARATWAMIRRKPVVWMIVAGVAAAWFQFGWNADHPYNLLPYHLHNDVAMWLNDAMHRACVTPFAVWGLLTLCRLSRADFPTISWAVATVLTLVPSWMIEHRYAIVPLALWLLLRPAASATTERAQLAWLVVLGAGSLWVSTLAPYGL